MSGLPGSRRGPCLAGLLLLGACRAEPPAPGPTALADAVRWTAPAGWTVEEGASGPDRSVHMSSGAAAIRLQLLGGAGSMFPRPQDLLAALGARSELGAPSERAVGGAPARCWAAARSVMAPPPATETEALAVVEQLCIAELAGGRYLVVGVEARGPAGGAAPAAPAEWPVFRAGVSLRKP